MLLQYAATCQSKQVHRAALGISEVSDAIALVVSEETGTISYAKGGELKRYQDRQSLYEMLTEEFIRPIEESALESTSKNLFRRKEKNNEKQ